MAEFCGCNYVDCALCGMGKAEAERDEARRLLGIACGQRDEARTLAWELLGVRPRRIQSEYAARYPWLKEQE